MATGGRPSSRPGASGRGGNVIPNLNRREALGVLGTIGAAASALPAADDARAGHVEVGRLRQAGRRAGEDDRRPGGRRGALLRGGRAASSASPGPRITSSGTP